MNTGNTVFAQLIKHMPLHQFHRCVHRYNGNHRVRSFSCLDQYLCLFFAQLTYRESLRDITICLLGMQNKLYHMSIRGKIARTTLADANETRDWRIYQDFAHILIHHAREIYSKEPFGISLKETVYALDSTTIDLCLALFPWAKFRTHKGAVKLHTLMDLRGNIPSFITLTDGKVHDVNILDVLIIEPCSFYITWIAAISISRDCSLSISLMGTLSSEVNQISYSGVSTPELSTKLPGSNVIKLSC
jgi:hypothetical protein